MPIAKVLPKICAFSAIGPLLFLAGCGGGGGVVTVHQTGNFSNASLNGSYVFQVHGFLSQSTTPYRQIGVLTADGAGHITNGVDVVNDGNGGAQSGTGITGTYTVASDGTGLVSLNSTALGSGSQITLAITLASTSKAELVEADAFADGAGDAELQSSTLQPSGAFAFRLHQEESGKTGFPASEIGAITVSAGSFTGDMDENLTTSSSSLTLSGSFISPSSQGLGTGVLTDSSNFTVGFAYCVVSSGKFVFLVTDAGAIGSGSAEAQSGPVGSGLAGTYAFGSRGDDQSFWADVATVGVLTGSGATISGGTFDSLQEGTTYQQAVNFTGTANGTPSAAGRVAVTLSTSILGTGNPATPVIFRMVNASRAFYMFENAGIAEDGTADLQTGTSINPSSAPLQFAMVMDGIDLNPEAVARIGTMQFQSGSKSNVVELVNDSSSGTGAQPAGAMSGTYSAGTGGRITATVANGGGGLDLVMYTVSGSQAYVLQADPNVNTSGILELQQ